MSRNGYEQACDCLTCRIRRAIMAGDPAADYGSGEFTLEVGEVVNSLARLMADICSELEDDEANAIFKWTYEESRQMRQHLPQRGNA